MLVHEKIMHKFSETFHFSVCSNYLFLDFCPFFFLGATFFAFIFDLLDIFTNHINSVYFKLFALFEFIDLFWLLF